MSKKGSLEKAQKALGKIGGETAERQIFLCAVSEKQKCCSRDDGKAAWNYLKKRLKELADQHAMVNSKSGDTPLGSMTALTRTQEAMGQHFVVVSGTKAGAAAGGKSKRK